MKKSELIQLLTRCHAELEAVTDRVGCDFETAIVLVDCENALNAISKNGQPAVFTDGLSLVH